MTRIIVENLSDKQFSGWVRTTTDSPGDYESGILTADNGDTSRYQYGSVCGEDVWRIDLDVTLAPGERKTYQLKGAHQCSPLKPQLPSNPHHFFGGDATVCGVPFRFFGLPTADGAAIVSHLYTRFGQTFVAHLWITWYPDQPAWCRGELVVTSSSPLSGLKREQIPADFAVKFGDAIVLGPGGRQMAPIEVADGQARGVPLVFLWPRHLDPKGGIHDLISALAVADLGINAVGCTRILPESVGQPLLATGFDSRAWAASLLPQAIARIHDWRRPVTGPSPRSGDTGAQDGEQVFVRGECLDPIGGPGATLVTYLSALKMLGRPCHFHDALGLPIHYGAHPNCVTWDGRPHWHAGVSPDRLGAETLTEADTTFDGVTWNGPDREHWMYNTVAAAARLTGSHALQYELNAQATLFMLGETIPSLKPGWSTNGAGAARAVGYAGMLAVRLVYCLEDQRLALDIEERYKRRAYEVYLPILNVAAGALWDQRLNDPRLGPGWRYMPWQNALGCYGLDEACEYFDIPEGRALALKAAKALFADAFLKVNGQWTMRYVGTYGQPPDDRDLGYWDQFGAPLCPATILRHEPTNAAALEAAHQLRARATQQKHVQWHAPSVEALP